MKKPTIQVQPDGKNDALPAAWLLANLSTGSSFHVARDWRHPLGVYNISISRICRKIEKCAELLYDNWSRFHSSGKVKEEIVDYLELVIYAAAEHVDDIEHICKTFFRSDAEYASSPLSRKLKSGLKPLRDEISNIANTIKHAHGRIRLLNVGFAHDGESIGLLGFFIEGVKNQSLGPHKIIHSDGKVLISVTSFLWNVMTYLSEISFKTNGFLVTKSASTSPVSSVFGEPNYGRTALSLTRLPLYSFDEVHPFDRITWTIQVEQGQLISVNLAIYGSLFNGWSTSDNGRITQTHTEYSGDGISKTFSVIQPKSLNLLRWN